MMVTRIDKTKGSERPGLRVVPPDAAASYLGAYTLRNEWAIWLLKNDPHLLSLSPRELHRSDIGPPPACVAPEEHWSPRAGRWYRKAGELCGSLMKYRPGFWCCYQHRETVRVRVFLKVPDGHLFDDDDRPVTDVLSLVGEDVDVHYRDGKLRVVKR